MSETLSPLDVVLMRLKAAGEETRLRILVLLMQGELSVTDLTTILAQSQPRISRHLKLLAEAGLIERHREGAWMFYRLSASHTAAGQYVAVLMKQLDLSHPQLMTDLNRMKSVREARSQAALAYFNREAANWDHIRSRYVSDERVEEAIINILRPLTTTEAVRTFLDLGTGTGRILTLLAPMMEQSVGMDASPAMLAVARANLHHAGLTQVELRQADLYALPADEGQYDLIVIHQVLHHLDDPLRALHEARRLLKIGGHLLIVDFAPHTIEDLREKFAHQRLGFSHTHMQQWLTHLGLKSIETCDVKPFTDESGHLTVTLWLARHTRVIHDAPLSSYIPFSSEIV
jgi:ubiquinone/menaquinone biosynthesis C-methylase UbiE